MHRVGLLLLGLLAGSPAASAQTQLLWTEDWSGGLLDWAVTAGYWDAGPIQTTAPLEFDGPCAGTNLSGNYVDNVTTRLERQGSFTVPMDHPRLRFVHWYRFHCGDAGRVQLSDDGGVSWVNVGSAFDGNSGPWTETSIDLSAYAGVSVRIGFLLSTTSNGCGTTVAAGWYIDNLELRFGENGPLSVLEDFESGTRDWWASDGVWEIGNPASGPGGAHCGNLVAATVLAGDYVENQTSRLISPPFTVPSAVDNPRLKFWQWYRFACGDSGRVEISPDGGVTWDALGTSFTGNGGAWFAANLDLAAYADQTVLLAFRVSATANGCGTTVDDGWYIDDIEIESSPGILDFVRGDCNSDGSVSIADAVFTLEFLFGSHCPPSCRNSCDFNDDESLNLADAVYILNYLFAAGPAIPAPNACGPDSTPGLLSCLVSPQCP